MQLKTADIQNKTKQKRRKNIQGRRERRTENEK